MDNCFFCQGDCKCHIITIKRPKNNDINKIALEKYPIIIHSIMDGTYDINEDMRKAFIDGYNFHKQLT